MKKFFLFTAMLLASVTNYSQAQIPDVIAHDPLVDIHVGPVIEDGQGSCDVDLQTCRYIPADGISLFQQLVIKILQNRHVLRSRIIEIIPVDLMDASVDDRLFNRLQPVLSAYDQLAEGKNKV